MAIFHVQKVWMSNLFHDRGRYDIETSPLIFSVNKSTGFYILRNSVMNELRNILMWREDKSPPTEDLLQIAKFALKTLILNLKRELKFAPPYANSKYKFLDEGVFFRMLA